MTRNYKTGLLVAGLALAVGMFALPSDAFAADAATREFFGSDDPFTKVQTWITGPFAIFITVIGLVLFGAMAVFGSDFSGFGRRVPMLLLGIAFVMGAITIVSNLFGSSTSGALYEPHLGHIEQKE